MADRRMAALRRSRMIHVHGLVGGDPNNPQLPGPDVLTPDTPGSTRSSGCTMPISTGCGRFGGKCCKFGTRPSQLAKGSGQYRPAHILHANAGRHTMGLLYPATWRILLNSDIHMTIYRPL